MTCICNICIDCIRFHSSHAFPSFQTCLKHAIDHLDQLRAHDLQSKKSTEGPNDFVPFRYECDFMLFNWRNMNKYLIVLKELYTYYTYYSTYIHLIIWSLPFFESCRIIDSSTSERCSEPLRSFLFFRNFMRPNLGSKKRIKTWYLTRILQNLFRKNPLGFSYANCFRPSVLPMISQFLSPISIYFLYISVEVTAWRCTRRVDMSLFSLMSKDSPRKRIPWSLVLVLLLNFSF